MVFKMLVFAYVLKTLKLRTIMFLIGKTIIVYNFKNCLTWHAFDNVGPLWASWVVEDVTIISRLLLILWRNPAFLPSTDGCWLHRTALPPEQGRSGGICLG